MSETEDSDTDISPLQYAKTEEGHEKSGSPDDVFFQDSEGEWLSAKLIMRYATQDVDQLIRDNISESDFGDEPMDTSSTQGEYEFLSTHSSAERYDVPQEESAEEDDERPDNEINKLKKENKKLQEKLEAYEHTVPWPAYPSILIGSIFIIYSIIFSSDILLPAVGVGMITVALFSIFESQYRGGRER